MKQNDWIAIDLNQLQQIIIIAIDIRKDPALAKDAEEEGGYAAAQW